MGVLKSLAAVWLLAGALAFPAAASTGFNLSELQPGVFVHLGKQLTLDVPGHDDIANIGFIVGDRCVAVIDTGGSAAIGRELRAAIGKRTALPVCYVINTHVHVDHVLGNAAFDEEGVSFVGSARLSEAIARSRDFFVREYAEDLASAPGARQVIGPDRLVDDELVLELGTRQLQLRAWPTAHSDCDLTVYDPKSGTLWTGDLLSRERLPALDGSVKGWLSALDAMKGMKVKFVVPGHGPATHDLAAAIVPERRYLQALADGVRAELAKAEPVDDAIEHVAAAEKPRWALWDKVHPHNVVRAYQELEWE
jgi:quinoprotein relay system zinc metallohydrolase 2